MAAVEGSGAYYGPLEFSYDGNGIAVYQSGDVEGSSNGESFEGYYTRE